MKYKVTMSESVTDFSKGLKGKDKRKFNKAIEQLEADPFKNAKPVGAGLIVILEYLEKIGVSPITMKMTKEQKRLFNEKVKSMDKDVLRQTLKDLK